jgi:hypothetical protein
MDPHLPHPRQIQAQLEALDNEIQRIREGYVGHITGPGQRLQEAENLQRQLRHQLNAAMDRSGGPVGDSYSGHSSSHIALGSLAPRSSAPTTSHNLSSARQRISGTTSSRGNGPGYTSLPATTSAGYMNAPSRPPAAPIADWEATPCPRRAVPHPQPGGLQLQQQQQATVGSKDNADYLPMVMENILAEHNRHKNKGTLRSW